MAAAKGPVQLCGAQRCGMLGDERTAAFPLVAPAGAKLRPPAAPAPYYVVRFRDVGGARGYRKVEDPRGWLSLYSIGSPVASAPRAGGWVRIFALSNLNSPWSDGRNELSVSRKGAYLRRDGQLVSIPADTAERIRARLPLDWDALGARR
jgi:hypothetical protein